MSNIHRGLDKGKQFLTEAQEAPAYFCSSKVKLFWTLLWKEHVMVLMYSYTVVREHIWKLQGLSRYKSFAMMHFKLLYMKPRIYIM
jgi:hypothetical protein